VKHMDAYRVCVTVGTRSSTESNPKNQEKRKIFIHKRSVSGVMLSLTQRIPVFIYLRNRVDDVIHIVFASQQHTRAPKSNQCAVCYFITMRECQFISIGAEALFGIKAFIHRLIEYGVDPRRPVQTLPDIRSERYPFCLHCLEEDATVDAERFVVKLQGIVVIRSAFGSLV